MLVGDSSFFQALATIIIAASATVLIARWLKLPSIVSFIAAGLIIGPATGLLEEGAKDGSGLALFGEMGIVLLLFVVGLELSLGRIREVGKVAVAAGLGQVVFTAVIGFGLCISLGLEPMESIFVATALTFSSTAVVVKLLDQKGELQSLYGQIAVGIFLVQDIIVIIVLTVLSGLSSEQGADTAGVIVGIAKAFGGMLLLLSLALLGGRYLLPPVLGWASKSPPALFIWALAWCIALVMLAHALGLSAEIGAFLAGLAIAQLGFAEDLRRRTHPLMTFFISLFFVSLGARMQFSDAGAYWLESIILSLFVLIGNPFIFIWIIARYGYSERTSFLTSVTVAQISEFSFIFIAMGMSAGLVSNAMISVVGVVGVVTMAASSYMILYNHSLYALISRWRLLRLFKAKQSDDTERPRAHPSGHIIVVGMNALGQRIAGQLHARGELVLAIDLNYERLTGLECRTLVGDVDYASTLEEAGLHGARLAISALRIENVNKLFAFRCREAGVAVAICAFDRPMLQQLTEVGADAIVDAASATGAGLLRELDGRLEGSA